MLWKRSGRLYTFHLMLECRACVLRCIRAIAGDAFRPQRLPRRRLLLTPRISHQTFRRHASTAVALPDHEDELVPGKQPLPDEDGGGEDGNKQLKGLSLQDKKNLNLELKWLSDPLKLAEHVHYTLRDNKPEKALDLCRLASKKQEVIVSWNHVVDWHMSKGKVDQAIKIYNEMKKRAQFPDAYTYTILLRGLARTQNPAQSQHHGQRVKESNVSKAVSIYNSMSSPTSRVRPSIYHTNAVLKVCSSALDMDALWGIVSKLPSQGAAAPDHITYATLLTAIRHGAFGDSPEDVMLEQISARRNKAVQEGRGVWRDVIARWRAGEIKIDEELVCAMGRLLMLSSHMQDWDDVLNLIQQTMKIERQIPPLGSSDRHIEHVPQDNDLRTPDPEAEEDTEGYKDTPATKAFLPVQPMQKDSAYPNRPTHLAWVQPANPTLSLLVGTCSVLRTPKTAMAYWDLLTSPQYQLKPDVANFHALLRLLSKNRSSAKAVSIVRDGMANAGVVPQYHTFRIAMSVCVRDKNNPNVLDHAREIVDVMEKVSADLDVHTLVQYLSLALTTDSGPKIVATLNRLDPIIHNLRSRILYGADDETHRPTPEAHLQDKEETIQFLQNVVGAIDTLMHRGLVPRDDFGSWHARRSQLNQFIGRAKNSADKQRARMEHDRNLGEGGRAWEKGMSFVSRGDYGIDRKAMGRGEHAMRKFRKRELIGRGREREREREKSGDGGAWGGLLGASRREKRAVKFKVLREGFADSPAELGARG